MTRRLLPYEYDLIETLGVTKEEYFDFLDKQHIHCDVKDGTILDVRNEPTAVILFVVGLIFQAAALLLAPKPPRAQEGAEQTRDQRVGRRTGFNGTQDLAVYGEAVPLVYTNTSDNNLGGVRVSTLLLWSAVLSFGNHQFMRLMMTIGAARIRSIDPERTAIGQFPARDLVLSNVWQYFNPNGHTQYKHLQRIDNVDARDPTNGGANQATARIDLGDDLSSQEGFSQAFSPTTAESVGVTGFIPVNVDLLTLNKAGDPQRKIVNISLTGAGNYWPNTGSRNTVPVGAKFTLIVPQVEQGVFSSDTRGIARQDAVRAASALIDNGSLFKAGSVLLRVRSAEYSKNGNIETSDLRVELECVRSGKLPHLAYRTLHWLDIRSDERKKLDEEIARNFEEVDQNKETITLKQSQLAFGKKQLASTPVRYRDFTDAEVAQLEKEVRTLEQRNARLEGINKKRLEELQVITAEAVAPFFTKGLARVEEAAYASVTKCHVLDLALRFQVYRRLNGRNSVYGSEQRDYGHNPSDNGAKARTAMFAVWYKFNNEKKESRIPYIFCCRGFNEQDVFAYLKLKTGGAAKTFEVRLEAVVDSYTEVRTFNTKGYCYIDPTSQAVRLGSGKTGDSDLEVFFNGVLLESGDKDYPPYNKSPRDTSEFDLFNYDAYSQSAFSFDNGPEIQITAVNEQLIEPWANYSPNLYSRLSNFALHVVSGSGTQDLRSVSVWVDEGKQLRRLSTDRNAYGTEATGVQDTAAVNQLANSTPDACSSYAPDIFLDTVLDKDDGIGEYASLHSIDVLQLAISKRFCVRNKLFMDGVIADQRPWREFWSQAATFSLLELGKIGGRETLIPALPYVRGSGAITRDVSISALFNQGNILEGTLKEEFIDYGVNTQDVIVTVIYRNVERNGIFPRNNSVEVKLSDTADNNAIRQTIDASQFVTRRDQAILLGKFLCNTRRHSRRAIEFQTFPTDTPAIPGEYIYVETSNNQWDGIYTGRIEAGGVLNVPIATSVPNGSYNFLTYTGRGDNTRSFTDITVSNNTATELASRAGDLFVLGRPYLTKRVFRITEISMEEEGETTVRAIEHPCGAGSRSLIARGLDEKVNGLFMVDGEPE
jgi:hypothetical protein